MLACRKFDVLPLLPDVIRLPSSRGKPERGFYSPLLLYSYLVWKPYWAHVASLRTFGACPVNSRLYLMELVCL